MPWARVMVKEIGMVIWVPLVVVSFTSELALLKTT